MPQKLTFPLKQAYDDSRRTIFGLQRGHQATIMDLFETDVAKTTQLWDVPPLDLESGGKPPPDGESTSDSSQSPSSSSEGEKTFPPIDIEPPKENQAEEEKELPKGYKMEAGRATRQYKGAARPPDVWPEMWRIMSKKQRHIEINRWNALQKTKEKE